MTTIPTADVVVVGSGLFGLTMAERIARGSGKKVAILENRSHVGGNAYSYFDESSGIEIHKYGSHIFHTSNERVWEYVNQFTEFNTYQHTVLAKHAGDVYSLPINLATINKFYKASFTPQEAEEFLKSRMGTRTQPPANLEEKAISLIGRDLYEAFVKNYTAKQWQTDPKLLSAEIISRLPVRFTENNRYFDDKYEGLPIRGYGKWLESMADHPNIQVELETDFFDVKSSLRSDQIVIYTGPVDKYFEYSHGTLGWRTLDFEFEHLDVKSFQGTAVMNYSDLTEPYTRIHEFKYFNPERKDILDSDVTVVAKEFSRFAAEDDEPYYPINTPEDRNKLALYRQEMARQPNVYFGGRLGSYQYLDMHMAIASALTMYTNEIAPRLQ